MAMSAMYPQRQALQRQRLQFAEGGPVDALALPPTLQRSWERTREAGVHPGDLPHYPAISAHACDAPDDRRLARLVNDEMERLWASFGGRHWTLFCVNTQGVIVAQRAHGLGVDPLLRPIEPGRRLHERDVGTTAPACVLADDLPAVVSGDQHYLSAFDPLFCLSVPLHGLDGELLGALDITGAGQRDGELLMGYFRQAAMAVHNRLFEGLRHASILAVQHDPGWIGTPMQGLVAVDVQGQVLAASRIARRLLGLPRLGTLPVMDLAAMFPDASAAQRRQLLRPGAPHRVRLREDLAVHVQLLRGPREGRGAVRTKVPRGTTLREQTRQQVAEALAGNGGNVAATARQLGISRTTLYRKLG